MAARRSHISGTGSAFHSTVTSGHIGSHNSRETIRRNLFSQTFIRRPNSNSTAGLSGPAPTADARLLEDTVSTHADEDVSIDILVRDNRSGDLTAEQLANLAASEEEAVLKEEEESGLACASGESKVDARLIELYRGRARGQVVDQAELKAAVFTNLRKKVTSLDDDKWMFEEDVDMETQS